MKELDIEKYFYGFIKKIFISLKEALVKNVRRPDIEKNSITLKISTR